MGPCLGLVIRTTVNNTISSTKIEKIIEDIEIRAYALLGSPAGLRSIGRAEL